jgi:hypothetical protein
MKDNYDYNEQAASDGRQVMVLKLAGLGAGQTSQLKKNSLA